MVVVGIEDVVLMVEFEVDELIEDQMFGVVLFVYDEFQVVICVVKELVVEVGKLVWDWKVLVENIVLVNVIKVELGEVIFQVYIIIIKQDCYNCLGELCDQVVVLFVGEEEGKFLVFEVKDVFGLLEYCIVCENIVNGKLCIDGCDICIVCLLCIEVGVFGKIYGFVLFICGEIQVLVVVIFGIVCDVQLLDILEGECKDVFMLYYNFLFFLVGECGCMGSLGCCEIGYGCLVCCGVVVMLLIQDEFFYIICVVFEIIEFNGFSLMVFVCGVFLVLMDVGVLVKVLVVGIVMGLVKEGEKFVVLIDIFGDEDYFGDMDFKVVGIDKGVIVLQMDIKINGIIEEIMEIVLGQVLEVCLNIFGQMNQVIVKLCVELFENVLIMLQMKIDLDKICDVIGKGGVIICGICEEIKVLIDIEDDGSVKIYGEIKEVVEVVKLCVLVIIVEVEIGKIYVGKVECIVDFGVFVNILLGKDGLVYILQISDKCIDKVIDVLQEGQEVKVLVFDVDNCGCIKLLIKDVVVVEVFGV